MQIALRLIALIILFFDSLVLLHSAKSVEHFVNSNKSMVYSYTYSVEMYIYISIFIFNNNTGNLYKILQNILNQMYLIFVQIVLTSIICFKFFSYVMHLNFLEKTTSLILQFSHYHYAPTKRSASISLNIAYITNLRVCRYRKRSHFHTNYMSRESV